MNELNKLLDRYGELLSEVDSWFLRCIELYPDFIMCRNGCSECCRGLFDITLLDALYLKRGFDRLPEQVKAGAVLSSVKRLKQLSQVNPLFIEPWLLNGIPEDDWDKLMPEDDETPCLLLSESGGCLVYEQRPMTCRLNGIPLIDVSGEDFFDEWCSLNFTDVDPRSLAGLRSGFMDLFARELRMFQELVFYLTGTVRNEVDLFIPAAVVMESASLPTAIDKIEQRGGN